MTKTYLRVFVNIKQNDWARFLLITKFNYNNIKNTSIGYIFFKLNCGYYCEILYKEKINLYFKFKSEN